MVSVPCSRHSKNVASSTISKSQYRILKILKRSSGEEWRRKKRKGGREGSGGREEGREGGREG